MLKKENVSRIVQQHLCMGCGICKDACPKTCISICHTPTGIYPIVDESACINCKDCLKSCPGKGVKLKEKGHSIYASVSHNKFVGAYFKSYTGWSENNEIRLHSASGGVITQFLIYLLKTDAIDGAVVVGFSQENMMLSKPYIARTPEEIVQARSSKYCTTSIEGIIKEIKEYAGRYVVVGLPCHIQAYRLFAETHKIIRDRIVGYFGIYCSLNKINISTDYYCYRYGVAHKDMKSFAYRDDGCMGYMKFTRRDDSEKKIPYVHFWLGSHSFFINKRCLVCNDHFAELADISFGDINVEPYNQDKIGINSLVARSEYWNGKILSAAKDGYLHLEQLPLSELIRCQGYAKRHKKGGGIAAERKLRSIFGWKNPIYDDETVKPSIKDYIKQLMAWGMMAIGKNRHLWFVVKALDKYKD